LPPLLLALALSAAPPAGAEGGAVRVEASLHLRWTSLANRPSNDVLFDPATRTFDLAHYLVTEGHQQYGSAFAAFRLDGRHLAGALRWTLAFDTGELRRRREPELVDVCASSTSPTGLDLAGQPGCRTLPGVVPLESTTLGPARLTSNGRTVKEELEATLLIREARVAFTFGKAGFATVRAGRSRYAVADGLIHDDYATGADVALDLGALGPPFELRAAVFQPTRDWARTVEGISPMVVLRADWLPSLFEHAGLFLAARRDRTGSVAELFRGALAEDAVIRLAGLEPGMPGYAARAQYLAGLLAAAPDAEAALAWAGVSGSLLVLPGHRLEFTGALQGGELQRLGTDAAGQPLEDVRLTGRAVSLRWTWSPASWLGVTPWFLYLSGDRPPTEKRRLGLPQGYAGFLGVAPYVTSTNLFFLGGLSETFAARLATAPGVSGRGVIAPGLSAEADLPGEVGLVGRAAWLRAEDAGPYGGRTYGTELDLTARWWVRPWLALAAEGDVLLPGDFFGGDRAVSKVVLGLDLLTP
jgi:hypothetical protein